MLDKSRVTLEPIAHPYSIHAVQATVDVEALEELGLSFWEKKAVRSFQSMAAWRPCDIPA